MHKLILCFLLTFIFANFAESKEKQEVAEKKNLLILYIESNGKIFIRGKEVTEEQLKKLLNQISEIDKSFPIYLQGDKNLRHQEVKKILKMITETGLYSVKFTVTAKKSKPVPDPKPEKPLYIIHISKDAYKIGSDIKTIQELKKILSQISDKDKKSKSIIIEVEANTSQVMMINLMDICMADHITKINVVNIKE